MIHHFRERVDFEKNKLDILCNITELLNESLTMQRGILDNDQTLEMSVELLM